jgi:hypothetical protein
MVSRGEKNTFGNKLYVYDSVVRHTSVRISYWSVFRVFCHCADENRDVVVAEPFSLVNTADHSPHCWFYAIVVR